jgi:hypothetical protein
VHEVPCPAPLNRPPLRLICSSTEEPSDAAQLIQEEQIKGILREQRAAPIAAGGYRS